MSILVFRVSKSISKSLIAGLLTSLFATASAQAQATAETPKTLRVGIGLAVDSVQARAVNDFGARVARLTQGALRIELYAAGKLGNDVTMVKAVQEGTQEITIPDSSTLASLERSFSAINYPFTFLSEVEADTVLDGAWGQRLLEKLPAHGLIGLAYWENGFRQMTNSRKSLTTAADFDGIRMRTMQNPMLVDSFNRLGFQAVPMPFTQVYDALKTQTVDGQENPLPTILSSRFYEVQKYLTLSRHVYSAHVILVSKKVWDGLSPQHQNALRTAAVESRLVERRLSREGSEQALADLKAKGMTVSTIPRADAERIRNRLRGVFDKYNVDIGASTMIDLYVELGRMRTSQQPVVATTLAASAPQVVEPKAAKPGSRTAALNTKQARNSSP
ncbi:MAG: DctP family TRAP transporter solute-binding subunit [Rhizobacter sp.]